MTRELAIYGLVFLVVAGVAMLLVSRQRLLPFQDVASNEVKLITRVPEKNPVNLQALIIGRLWIVDGCVTIGDAKDKSRTTIWRAGYRVGEDDKGMFVHHPDKKERYRVGAKVRFGGGYVESLSTTFVTEQIDGDVLKDCSGPFILVDSTDAS